MQGKQPLTNLQTAQNFLKFIRLQTALNNSSKLFPDIISSFNPGISTKRHKTHLVFSFESSSDSSVAVTNDVISPKDSFTSPKKSFTLSATVFSLSGVGS